MRSERSLRLRQHALRPRLPSKAYVVMGNDYPDRVFIDEAAAERYVAERKAAEATRQRATGTRAIHWRAYEMPLGDGK